MLMQFQVDFFYFLFTLLCHSTMFQIALFLMICQCIFLVFDSQCVFSWLFSNIFSLLLVFNSFIIICLYVIIFLFFVLWAKILQFVGLLFSNLENFQHYFFKYFFCLFVLFLSAIPDTHMCGQLIFFHISVMLC